MVYIYVTASIGNCPMVTCLSSIASPQLPFTDEGVPPLSSIHSPVHANFTPVGNISSVFPSTLRICPTAIFNTLTHSSILAFTTTSPSTPNNSVETNPVYTQPQISTASVSATNYVQQIFFTKSSKADARPLSFTLTLLRHLSLSQRLPSNIARTEPQY